MSLKKHLLSFATAIPLLTFADPLATYSKSVATINKFLVDHPDLRTHDDKKCHVNVQSEWKAESKKFKLKIDLVSESLGEVSSFSIDTIGIAEMYQSHVLLSESPLHLSVINYASDGFGHWAENSKQLQLSPYAIRIIDLDPSSGEPLGQVSCTLPDLPLAFKNL